MDQVWADIPSEFVDLLKASAPYLFTIYSGYLGYRYGVRQFREQKGLEFIERQIREFYSPMLGYVKQKRAKSDLRYEINQVSDPAWRKIVERQPEPFLDHDKYFEPFKKAILYDNDQLRNELIPLYDRMVEIFSENY